MATFPKNHSTLYFDALIRTQKSESLLSLIQATYHVKKLLCKPEEAKAKIAERLQHAFALFKDNVNGYDNGYGSYEGKESQFDSQYTLGHEMAIWLNSNLDLNPLALKVAKNNITIKNYLDIIMLNYIQPVNESCIHPLYAILTFMQKNGLKAITKKQVEEALKVPTTQGSLNGLIHILLGTNYFSTSDKKEIVYTYNLPIDKILSLCNLKYLGSEGYKLAKQELDETMYNKYIIEDRLTNELNFENKVDVQMFDVSADYKENEKKFREWMSTQESQNGSILRPTSISSNCSALNKVCELIEIVEYPELTTIFQITSIDIYNEVRDIIKTNPGYAEANKSTWGFLSTGLKWYAKYLDEMFTLQQKENEVDASVYDKSKFLSDVFMSEEQYERLKKLLFYKKNIILQGAPGVGKTYLAKKFAYSILGESNDKYIEIIQFHQNYSYEDFIMGYKPVDDGFELRKGVFYSFCKKAESEPNKNFFFIIDEINRGNLSKIFGELMMLIEKDKRGDKNKLKLAYKNELFSVPENLYIIGMMNTADRSLAMMDYALRRRFSFFEVEPAFDKESFKNHISTYVSSTVVDKVVSRFNELNQIIADEDNSGLGRGYCIGHSYFCIKPVEGQTAEEWYDTIIDYEIAPLLYEYWWDDKSKADDCIKELKR